MPSIYSSARTELAKLLIYGLFRKIRVLAQDGEPMPISTTVTPEKSCTLITRNDSPDVPFELSINPVVSKNTNELKTRAPGRFG